MINHTLPHRFLVLTLAGLSWLALSCSTPEESGKDKTTTTNLEYTMDGAMTQIQEIANPSWKTLTLTLNLGDTAHDVYFAFTNHGPVATSAVPKLSAGTSVSSSLSLSTEATEAVATPRLLGDAPFHQLPVPRRTPGAVSQSVKLAASVSLASSSSPTASYSVGSTRSYTYFSYNGTVSPSKTGTATLVAQNANADQGRIVNVWSLPTATGWTAGVSAVQAQALADYFLSSSDTGNDIYSWETGIFGREFYEPGTSVASDLISPTGEIDIVLCDLNQNNSSGSSVQGYFYALDEYQASAPGFEDSNERLAFFVDGPTYTATTSTWSIGDDGPTTILSTLAHEFQHMVHYYQKTLAQGLSGESDTWINEMASMVAEDLVADKMMVAGPRGVPLSGGAYDYTSGALSTNANSDRIAIFNSYYPKLSLTGSGAYTVYDYSMGYSFGSWLARNYGGPELFRQIVQNSDTDFNAVVNAVNAVNGTAVSEAQLLRLWAGAVVASTSGLSAAMNLQRTSPDYFSFTQTSAVSDSATQTFALGSIDYGKYYAYGTSPRIAGPVLSSNTSYFGGLSSIPAKGLYLLKPRTGATGTQKLTLTVPSTVDLTVITKVTP